MKPAPRALTVRRLAVPLIAALAGGCEGSDGGAGGAAGQAGGEGGSGGQGGARFGLAERPANPTCRAPGRPTGAPGDPFPQTLAATGCFRADDPRQPVAGVIPFGVAAPLWSDAAGKRRWLALPDGATITVEPDGDLTLPVGSVLIKEFELDGVLLETRFLYRHEDGDWAGYTYRWNDEGTDATLLGEGTDFRFVGDLEWVFPSRANCLACHTQAAGRSLGLEIAQLNHDFEYPGRGRFNQIATLDHIGLFARSPGNPADLPAFTDPGGTSGTVEARARAYLHSNCSHCHRPDGLVDASGREMIDLDLRYTTTLADAKVCNVTPAKSTFGVRGSEGDPEPKLVVPGRPDLSILLYRMRSSVQDVRMPAIGTSVVDPVGVMAVSDWIGSLMGCP